MSSPEPPTQETSPYAVLRNRDFLFYAVGRFIASFGSQMLTVAVGWELCERTGSAMALGMTGLMQFLPILLMTVPGGHFADTRSRKGIIMAAQAVMAAASLGLALVSWRYAGIPRTHGGSLVGLSLPVCIGCGADFSLVGQRVIPAAVGFAGGISTGLELVVEHISILGGDRSGSRRVGDWMAQQRVKRLCLQCGGGGGLPGVDCLRANASQAGGQRSAFFEDAAGRFSILFSTTRSYWG